MTTASRRTARECQRHPGRHPPAPRRRGPTSIWPTAASTRRTYRSFHWPIRRQIVTAKPPLIVNLTTDPAQLVQIRGNRLRLFQDHQNSLHRPQHRAAEDPGRTPPLCQRIDNHRRHASLDRRNSSLDPADAGGSPPTAAAGDRDRTDAEDRHGSEGLHHPERKPRRRVEDLAH